MTLWETALHLPVHAGHCLTSSLPVQWKGWKGKVGGGRSLKIFQEAAGCLMLISGQIGKETGVKPGEATRHTGQRAHGAFRHLCSLFLALHPKPPSFNLLDIFSENARHYEVIPGPQLLPNFILQRPVLCRHEM